MLTVEQIKGLGPKQSSYRVLDGDGLSLHVRPSGMKSWSVRYQVKGRPANLSVGRWPDVGIVEARKHRNKIKDAAHRGLTQAESDQIEQQKLERGATVRQFGDRYMREMVRRVRKDPDAVQRYLARDIYPAIGDKRMADVKLYELRCLIFEHRDQGHDQAALALRDLLKRIWDYAVLCEVVASNPLQALKRQFIAKSTARSRALEPAEVGALVNRVRQGNLRIHLRVALQLILLTLARKSEVLQARWKHIDLRRQEWTIPPEHTKNKKTHVVYLSAQVCRLLGELAREFPGGMALPSYYVIHAPLSKTQPISRSTLNRALGRLSKGIEHFTVHDLRRTAATLLSDDEYQADVIEKALNHTIKGVRGVYNRAQLKRQRKQMLADWGDKVEDWTLEYAEGCIRSG